MNSSFQKRELSGTTVIDAEGEMTLLQGRIELGKEIRSVTSGNLLINFMKVKFIDSSVVGGLLDGFLCTTGRNNKFALCSIENVVSYNGRSMIKLLELSQLSSVLKVYADEASAIQAFHACECCGQKLPR